MHSVMRAGGWSSPRGSHDGAVVVTAGWEITQHAVTLLAAAFDDLERVPPPSACTAASKKAGSEVTPAKIRRKTANGDAVME